MSRRNLAILFTTFCLCVLCAQRVGRTPAARYVAACFEAIERWGYDQAPEEQLVAGAVEGMVGVLRARGDEHSQFIRRDETADFQDEMQQEFGGVGVRIRMEGDPPRLTIVGPPEPGSPAHRSGVLPGDVVTAVDGLPTQGLSLDACRAMMRGVVGEPLTLQLLRPGSDEPTTLRMVREIIDVPSVLGDRRGHDGEWRYLLEADPRVAYVRIVIFGAKTRDELSSLLPRLTEAGARALVLDLRDNPGGVLDGVVQACDLLLPAGAPIVETRGRYGQVLASYTATGEGEMAGLARLPLAVLIDRNTASAAEIMAAALQDDGRAVVVGERSFGKGTVQRIVALESDKSLLKLTWASFWRPSGKNIHRWPGDPESVPWGVSPDPGLEAPMPETDEAYMEWRRRRAERDLTVPAEPAAGGGAADAPAAPADGAPREDPATNPLEDPATGPEQGSAAGPERDPTPWSDPALDKALQALRAQIDPSL